MELEVVLRICSKELNFGYGVWTRIKVEVYDSVSGDALSNPESFDLFRTTTPISQMHYYHNEDPFVDTDL